VTIARASAFVLIAALGAIQFSIAAGQILLGLAALGWLVVLIQSRGAGRDVPAFFLPLVLYAVWTLVATVFSRDPAESLRGDKELLLLLVVPMTMRLLRGHYAQHTLDVIISVGAAVALIGVFQYALFGTGLSNRPRGTLGHYMTYSGVLMLLVCATVARLLFQPGRRIWPALMMPALLVALAVTLSRNAYVGAAIGVTVLLLLRDFRLVALVPVAAVAFVLVAPDPLVDRAYSMFDLRDSSNRDRVAMAQAGVTMIEEEPLTGVGPHMVARVYPQYRTIDAVDVEVQHLHNVPLHIAAERGLPALMLWIWFVVAAGRDLLSLVRREGSALAAAGLAALVAMVAAGLFEYNFGDSEFLVLLLALLTLPFSLRLGPGYVEALAQGKPPA
jgi:O-antigen ligase